MGACGVVQVGAGRGGRAQGTGVPQRQGGCMRARWMGRGTHQLTILAGAGVDGPRIGAVEGGAAVGRGRWEGGLGGG